MGFLKEVEEEKSFSIFFAWKTGSPETLIPADRFG